MIKAILLTLVVALCVAMPASALPSWDLTTDSAAAVAGGDIPNTHGQWSHGYAATLTGDYFVLYDGDTWGLGDGLARWEWTGASGELPLQVYNTNAATAYGIFEAFAYYTHGGFDTPDNPLYTVMRWTTPQAGYYDISTLLAMAPAQDFPASVTGQVLVNGVADADLTTFDFGYISGNTTPATRQKVLYLGTSDIVDFVVGPEQTGGAQWTKVNVHIDEVVPEPGSMLALGTGLLGLAGFAIRRRRA